MTKAAAHFGKRLDKFFSTDETREYIDALDSISNATEKGELIETKRGNQGGTWAHPKLAVFFARWLSIVFADWCDSVIEDILTKKDYLTIAKPEHHPNVQSMLPNRGFTRMVLERSETPLNDAKAVTKVACLTGQWRACGPGTDRGIFELAAGVILVTRWSP